MLNITHSEFAQSAQAAAASATLILKCSICAAAAALKVSSHLASFH
jgi:hypothetical protein